MYLHPSMSDAEILRTCNCVESRHLRLLADRLRCRCDQLKQIRLIVTGAVPDPNAALDAVRGILD